MKVIKAIFFMLLALCLLCGVSIAACAHEVPDEDQKGTITVEMEYNGSIVTGGALAAYRVGQVVEDDGNYSFEKTDAMKDFTGSYENIDSADLAKAVAAYAAQKKITADATAKNENGKAVFSNMELGLYLIVQTTKSEGYEAINAFLVSIPMNEEEHYVYEVTAEGKFQLTQAPEPTTPDQTEPTTPDQTEPTPPDQPKPTPPDQPKPTAPNQPKDSTLPQTGQLNWPVPLLAVLGLCLFAVGWALRFGRKRDGYAE